MLDYKELARQISEVRPFDIDKVALKIKVAVDLSKKEQRKTDNEKRIEALEKLLNGYKMDLLQISTYIEYTADKVRGISQNSKLFKSLTQDRKMYNANKFKTMTKIAQVKSDLKDLRNDLSSIRHEELYKDLLWAIKDSVGEEKAADIAAMARKRSSLTK